MARHAGAWSCVPAGELSVLCVCVVLLCCCVVVCAEVGLLVLSIFTFIIFSCAIPVRMLCCFVLCPATNA